MPESSIWAVGNTEFSDGPDRGRGGNHCAAQHDGVREGQNPTCCCCDPCRYQRPPRSDTTDADFTATFCCRCAPRLVCMTFTPDAGAEDCCRTISVPLLAQFYLPPENEVIKTFPKIFYTGTISGVTCVLSIAKEEEGGPCYWKITTTSGVITSSSSIEVDHVNVTCLSIPSIEITGVTDSRGCVGTITFANYDSVKLPFHHDIPSPPYTEMITLPPGVQCNCSQVPKYLCVDGIRHNDYLVREQVKFIWDESRNDRWSYLPCDGNASTDQEHIYLRGDHYGNCYLELDFEQSGSDTNDWGRPPNTLGVDPYEVRQGMIPVESCGCDIHAHSNISDSQSGEYRYVNISAGDCGCWKYHCGKCRCVPVTVCLAGEIDGEVVVGKAQWNGDGWVFPGIGTVGPFLVKIGPNECGDCVLTVDGTFTVPLEPSSTVACGELLSGELASAYDADNPQAFNWLWVSTATCSECHINPCGICAEERCGGPPATIYYEIDTMPMIIDYVSFGYNETCNITIPLHYFQRLILTNGPADAMFCGYIGYKVLYCPDVIEGGVVVIPATTTIIRVSISYFRGESGWFYEISKATLGSGPLIYTPITVHTHFPPAGWSISCDPFVVDSGWSTVSNSCKIGCRPLPSVFSRETFVE